MTERRCPSCGGGSLKRGFIYVRNSETPTLFDQALFVEGGAGEQSDLIAAARAPQFKLEPHRCEGCGHVAWFAPTATAWRR